MGKLKWLSVFLLVAAVASNGFAQEPNEKQLEKKAQKAKENAVTKTTKRIVKMFDDVVFSDEQTAQVGTIIESKIDEVMAAEKELKDFVTPEELKTIRTTSKEQRTAGVNGPDLKKAIQAAVKFSDEKYAQYEDLEKKSKGAINGIKDAVRETLTDEQKAALPKNMQAKKQGGKKGAGNGKNGKNKKAKEAEEAEDDAE